MQLRMKAAIAAASLAATAAYGQGAPRSNSAPPPIVIVPPAPPAPPAPPPPVTPARTPSLRGASVYIYNFLDFRAQQFGPRVLEQIDRQLGEQLAANGVRTERLLFQDSPVRLTYAEMNQAGQSVDRIPVPETVVANHEQETRFGAQYRLIIIPASFTIQGAWQYYDIRWILADVRTGQFLWMHVTSNRRLVLWRVDENSVRRGEALIGEVIGNLRARNLL